MRIAAVAHALPSRRVDNEELIDRVVRESTARFDEAGRTLLRERLEIYLRQTGIRTRFWRAEGEKAAALGLAASRRALDEGGVRPKEVDLLLFVGVGRGWVEPAMANLFLAELGLTNATGFDLVDACASWLRAVDLAAGLLRLGRCRNLLILNCEFNVKEHCVFAIPDLESLEHLLPGFTIGEAATATLITNESPENDFYCLFRTWGAHHGLCRIPLPNQEEYRLREEPDRHEALRFYAYGTTLTRTAMRRVVSTYHADPRFRANPIDICFGHSVSETVTTEVEQLLGLAAGTTYRTAATHGNTVSASLPLGMSLASRDGSLRRGQKVLFVMGSAGITVGLASLRY